MYRKRGRRRLDTQWDAALVRRLRRHLDLTQREFAAELNARQQTVSEWETGHYRPRGPSARLLSLIAEEAAFPYGPEVIGLRAGAAGTGGAGAGGRRREDQDSESPAPASQEAPSPGGAPPDAPSPDFDAP